jgi:signal transduction histidine kinase
MSLFQRHRWFAIAAGITLAFAVASLSLPKGRLLTAISDGAYFLLSLAVTAVMLANARNEHGANRQFWALMGAGALLWTYNQFEWVYFEVFLNKSLPDPYYADIILFLHLVPMIAAVGLRQHLAESKEKFGAGALDFLLLMVWWVFLYSFLVLPSQYISLDVAEYDRTWGTLYDVEGGAFLLVLGLAARSATGAWRLLYLNLMAAMAVYAIDSQLVNQAVAHGKYYSGCFYDVPLLGAMSWMAATSLSARNWPCRGMPPSTADDAWGTRTLKLAMLAILTLPALGLWAYAWDRSPGPARAFRLFTVLMAMIVMGVFVFIRQYFQDQRLIGLLQESRLSLENEERLQTYLVQREKLAALGQLIAGAAKEIDYPLTAIMDYSEKLWSNERLSAEQDSLVRKIVNHSQRTRDLISNLLSFAQQRPGEKRMVDLSTLLQRSVQMHEVQAPANKIHTQLVIEPDLPKVWGDGHQLFQAFVEIIENARDAIKDQGGGGVLHVKAQHRQDEVVVSFSDTGSGIKEPHRVFDPFYTTKPIGKGTGLGLSAVYGIVQDHHGQITCQNKAEGGALFVLKLPIAKTAEAQALAAAQT